MTRGRNHFHDLGVPHLIRSLCHPNIVVETSIGKIRHREETRPIECLILYTHKSCEKFTRFIVILRARLNVIARE